LNTDQVKDYFKFLAKQSGLPDEGLEEHVNRCITLGVGDFWNARAWSFRGEPYSLAITAEAEAYVLPDRFVGLRTVREQDSLEGNDLIYKPKEEFDHLVAKPMAYPSTYPEIYTVYYSSKTGEEHWYIKFFPVPATGYTMLIDMLTDEPGNPEAIPEQFNSGMIASISKYMEKLGTQARIAAFEYYEKEILKLERTDGPFMGRLFKMMDDTDTQIRVERPWI
jgi:hypothetical protein